MRPTVVDSGSSWCEPESPCHFDRANHIAGLIAPSLIDENSPYREGNHEYLDQIV